MDKNLIAAAAVIGGAFLFLNRQQESKDDTTGGGASGGYIAVPYTENIPGGGGSSVPLLTVEAPKFPETPQEESKKLQAAGATQNGGGLAGSFADYLNTWKGAPIYSAETAGLVRINPLLTGESMYEAQRELERESIRQGIGVASAVGGGVYVVDFKAVEAAKAGGKKEASAASPSGGGAGGFYSTSGGSGGGNTFIPATAKKTTQAAVSVAKPPNPLITGAGLYGAPSFGGFKLK